MILTIDQAGKLARLLVRCGRLTIQQKRDLIIERLPYDISVNIERAGSPADDVFMIVIRCNEYPGGIEKLVRIVHSSGKKYKPMKDVWEYLASVLRPNYPLTNGLLAWFLFFSSVAGIEGRDVDSVYNSIIPFSMRNRFHLATPKQAGLWKSVSQLSDLPPQQGEQQHLLLLFLRSLPQFLNSDRYKKGYYAWLSKIENGLGLEKTQTSQNENSPAVIDSKKKHVPDPGNPSRSTTIKANAGLSAEQLANITPATWEKIAAFAFGVVFLLS